MRRNVNIFNIRTKKKNKIYINSNKNCEAKNIKGTKIYLEDDTFIQSLFKYIGQTIIVYIVGNKDGDLGFTGVLLDIKKDYIKILSKAMTPPVIDLESECKIEDIKKNSLGIVINIPINKIAAFVHNAV
ncbi:hypothetical protein SAMN05428976_105156 [Clostridium sp. USBA 49]|uniref:hypothetical protein n=1 Tax=Clostridium sp. USBA 49 TaxID=1881060 RepID=UPI000999E54F|nr:hypothetical protein [Clostridium sp. USBA 49]SKA83023.1 hypothetical protein SAMN05428976_105156 [Clostridium sp. USBA 49]